MKSAYIILLFMSELYISGNELYLLNKIDDPDGKIWKVYVLLKMNSNQETGYYQAQLQEFSCLIGKVYHLQLCNSYNKILLVLQDVGLIKIVVCNYQDIVLYLPVICLQRQHQ